MATPCGLGQDPAEPTLAARMVGMGRVLLAAPRGYCAGRRARRRRGRAGARQARRAGLRAQADRAQPARRRGPRVQGRGLRGRGDRGPRGGGRRPLARTASRPGSTTNASAADLERDRRDLPARHEGARRGPAVRGRGPHDRPDRPRGPRGGRGHERPGARAHDPRADRRPRPRRSRSPDPGNLSYLTQTTLSVDETNEIIARSSRSGSRRSRGRRATTSATRRRTARTP